MTKIYTKTGDKGETSLYCGKRVPKTAFTFEVIGNIDELTSRIGMLYALIKDSVSDSIFLKDIQQHLQTINSLLATTKKEKYDKLDKITEDHVSGLECSMDEFDKLLPPLKVFILPGETQNDAQAHICRSQTRIVERLLWKIYETIIQIDKNHPQEQDLLIILRYMNRLSDFFFTYARYLIEIV